jgi:hypothetical protein
MTNTEPTPRDQQMAIKRPVVLGAYTLLVPKYNLTVSTLLSYRAHTQVTPVTAHHAAVIPQQRAMSE